MSVRRDFPDLPSIWAAGTLAAQWAAALLPLAAFGAWAAPLVALGLALAAE